MRTPRRGVPVTRTARHRPAVGTDACPVPTSCAPSPSSASCVMNFHGYLILRGGGQGDSAVDRFFDPWTGPLSTRFAATFVLVAGVGVTLLTRRRHDAAGSRRRQGPALDARAPRPHAVRRRAAVRHDLAGDDPAVLRRDVRRRRGAVHVARPVGRRRRRRPPRSPVPASPGGGSSDGSTGRRTAWLFAPGDRSPRGLLFDVAVNGTHPLLPWLAFFCAGIVLGRVLTTDWWRPAAIGGGLTMFGLATMISGAAATGRPRAPCWRAPIRSTAGCCTRRARWARRWSPSARSPGWPTASRRRRRSSCCATPGR